MILLFPLFFVFTLQSQEISRSIQSVNGESVKSEDNYALDYTIGAQFIQIAQEAHHLTEGFQQGILKRDLTVEDNVLENFTSNFNNLSSQKKDLTLNVSAFPNPTSNQLFLVLEGTQSAIQHISVYDQLGKEYTHQKINAQKDNIQVNGIQDLLPGLYYLKIYSTDSHDTITLQFSKI